MKTRTFWQSLRLLALASILFSGARMVEIAGPVRAAGPATADDLETIGPVTFACHDGSTIVATFDNALRPAAVLLVRGDQQVTLRPVISGSGARYAGDDIEFWNKGRDAMVEWQGQKLECTTAE